VVKCKGIGADIIFTLAVQKLEANLSTLNTAPPIIAAIMTSIWQWQKHGENHLPRLRQWDIYGSHHAVESQDKIGWYNFLLGRMSKKWSNSQQRYIDSTKRKNSGRRWTASVIQKALDIAWNTWEQRNNINQNTMHPRRVAGVEEIKAQLRVSFLCGRNSLLPIDRHLFSKSEATLLMGDPRLMLQWINLFLTSTGRAAVATEDLERTMTSKRALMRRWLK
jgi:hypothetical protein